MDPLTTTISCSVTLLPYHGSSMQSHTYLNVLIQRTCISECDGVMLITTANLLAALRKVSHVNDGVSLPLREIIFGLTNPTEIVVATMQVPSFHDDIENPTYGYRTLGLLSSVDVQPDFPLAPVAFDSHRDLLAVHSNGNTKTDAFYRIWRCCGLRLETHFLLMFSNTSSPSPSPAHTWNASPFTQDTFSTSNPSRNGSYNSSRGFQMPSVPNDESGSESRYLRTGMCSLFVPSSVVHCQLQSPIINSVTSLRHC
jgi:hypothetical protein